MKVKIEGPIDLKFHLTKDLFKPTNDRLKYLREQVARIKKMPQPEQRTQEWYDFRDERITASDFATALGEHPHGDQLKLLLRKVTYDRTFFTNSAILWGVKYEDVAIQIYEHRNKEHVVEYGCISHPYYKWLGASPDGITDDGIMLEIKCPSSRQITGEIPSYYWCQVQGQLEVCELDRCDFLECKLKEYDSRAEYEADNHNGHYFYNKFGMEKGAVVEYYKKDTKSLKFDYLPLAIMGDELDLAIEESKKKFLNDNIIFSGVDYWYLEEVSCIPIYRNQEWFHSKIPTFQSFWDKVIKYRELGGKACEKYVKEQKELKKLMRKKAREEAKALKAVLNKKSPKRSSKDNGNYNNMLMSKFVESNKKDEDIFLGFEEKKSKKKKSKEEKKEEPDPYDERNQPRPKLRFTSNRNIVIDDELDDEIQDTPQPRPKLRFSSFSKKKIINNKGIEDEPSNRPKLRFSSFSKKKVSEKPKMQLAKPKLRFSSNKKVFINE